MQNAFNMTHPVIPQSDTFATLEYLERLGIDENFKASDYAKKSEIPVVPDLTNNVDVSLISEYSLTVKGVPTQRGVGYVVATLNKKPFTGLEINFQCRAYNYSQDTVVGKVVFNSPTAITFTATPTNFYPKCSFDSENLTLTFTNYFQYNMSNVSSNTCVINTEKYGDSLILTKDDKTYNVYTKEQVDELINALREEFNSN